MKKIEPKRNKISQLFLWIKDKLDFSNNFFDDENHQNSDSHSGNDWGDDHASFRTEKSQDHKNYKNFESRPTQKKISYLQEINYDDHDEYHDNHADNVIDYELESYNQPRIFIDKDNPQTKKINFLFIIIMVICIIFLFLFLYLLFSKESKHPLNQSEEISLKKVLRPGEAKLDTPILGTPETDKQDISIKLNKNDPLAQIDFDFSPIISKDIARSPMLPNKIKPAQKTTTTESELQDLWLNGSQKNNTPEKQENIQSNNAQDYLPPWRRYSIDYKPTNGEPVFSIILEYDPEILSTDDLPKTSGYNVVMAGFIENAHTVFNQLREKKFEILLYLPMHDKTTRFNLKPINQKTNFDAIREAIAFHTSLFDGKGFVGFMNYGGKKIQNMLPKINFAMSVFAKTGFLYLDDAHDNTQSLAFAAAEGQKVPALKTKTYIQSVSQEFETFLKQVQMDGTGIAIVKATPENIIALEAYEKFLKDAKIHRIPLTGILKHQLVK